MKAAARTWAHLSVVSAAYSAAPALSIPGPGTTAKLKDIKVPVLALTGNEDAAAPGTRYIGENVPGAKFVGIPQAAHIANVEQPEAFNRALREFL